MLPASHPALLGVHAEHLTLLAAATHVAVVRAPATVFAEVREITTDTVPPGFAQEIRRALTWLAIKCAEPRALRCWHQDQGTGELRPIPAASVWRSTMSPNLDVPVPPSFCASELAPFHHAAILTLGVQCRDPALEIVISRAELTASLELDSAALCMWLAGHLDHLRALVAHVRACHDRGELSLGGDLLLPVLDDHLDVALEILAMTRPSAGAAASRKQSTKAAVASRQTDYRRRWADGAFASAADARATLLLELNRRPDGTVAALGDDDHHRASTVERLTRTWFVPRREQSRARGRRRAPG